MELANRQILITGANRGIGRAVAKMCAEDKANLHLVVRKKDDELIKEMHDAGARSVTLWEVDLRDRVAIAKLVQDLKDVSIDILFNNAGMFAGGQLEEQSLNEVYDMMQVNVDAVIHLTQAFLPGMLKRKRGKIINNSSVSAFLNFPGTSTYAASKAAVVAFTNALKLELKGTGVSTLLLVTPGIRTRMFDNIVTIFSKNIQLPDDSISPNTYAQMVREAILHDLEVIEPSGITGVGLKLAKFARPVFEMEVARRFKRS